MGKVVSIDHLVFGVKDLEAIFKILGKLLDVRHLLTLRISKSSIYMFQFGDKLPLVGFGSEPVGGTGFMASFLNEKGECLHHMRLQVNNLASFKENLIKNDISFQPWEPEGSNIKKEALAIDTEYWPTLLHITGRERTVPMTPQEWLDREKTYGVNTEKAISYQRSNRKTPSILRVDHIAFAVKDLKRTIRFVEDVLGGRYLFEFSLSKTISVAFVQIGETIVSLECEPMDGDGFVAKFLQKKGEGLHHIGLQVDDIDSFKEIMTANGIPVPPWDLEGDETQREEVLIGTKYFSTVLQIVDWKGNPPTTPQEWVDREKEFLE
jgi:methylmalonyl-CoA epimerase